MQNNKVVRGTNKNQAMRDKIRRWVMENPRAMDAAYAMAVGGTLLVTIQDAAGGSGGP